MPRKSKEKELVFRGRYKDFKDFYDINQESIYKSIVEIFEDFNKSKTVNKLSLRIEARIKGLEWDTKFDFNRTEAIVLKRDIIPYFEKMEDYETCSYINNLHKQLTSQ